MVLLELLRTEMSLECNYFSQRDSQNCTAYLARDNEYRRGTDLFKISFKIDPLNHHFGRFY